MNNNVFKIVFGLAGVVGAVAALLYFAFVYDDGKRYDCETVGKERFGIYEQNIIRCKERP